MPADPLVVVDQFVDAYSSRSVDKLLALCVDDVYVEHHNRDLAFRGRDALGEFVRGEAAAFPDGHFEDRRASYVDGDHVLVEHTWVGTAAVDVPDTASAGEVVKVELCTRYTVRDGLVAEFHDYG